MRHISLGKESKDSDEEEADDFPEDQDYDPGIIVSLWRSFSLMMLSTQKRLLFYSWRPLFCKFCQARHIFKDVIS